MLFEVSVIIPVYNAERFIKRAVESALQFEYVKEVLLIEDGSKDNSLSICRHMQSVYPEKVKLFQHPDGVNRGAGETRNVGLEKAQSNFIAFLDADDYYLENRFDKDIEVFAKYADCDGTYNALGADFENENVKETYFKKGMSPITTVTQEVFPEELSDVLLGLHKSVTGYFHLDTLTLKRDVLKRSSGFTPSLRLHQDTEWILKLAFLSRLYPGEIVHPVAIRNVHGENRITRFASYKSRALMYGYIARWAKNKNIDKKYKSLFTYQYVNHLLLAERSRVKRLMQGIVLSSDRDILLNVKCLKLIVRRIFITD